MQEDTPTSIKKLKVVELRQKCQSLGLEMKGTKQILINRILEHLGFTANDSQESLIPDDTITHTSVAEESVSKSDLGTDTNEKTQPFDDPSLSWQHAHIQINVSDFDRQDVELDFINDDLQEQQSPRLDPLKRKQPIVDSENWDEDGHHSIKASTAHIVAEKTKDYTVRYMDHVHLDPYVNDLHLTMGDDSYLTASNITTNELHNFWCGVKATHGVSSQLGAVGFSCEYMSDLSVDNKRTCLNGLRVGFSTANSDLHLGDSNFSCGYDFSGNVFLGGKSTGTFKGFKAGDRVTALANFTSSTSVTFTFRLNGEDIGHKSQIEIEASQTFFPHLYFLNSVFRVDFADSPPGYHSFASLKSTLTPGPRPPASFSQAKLIMMVGIMGVGKSTWVKSFLETNSQRFDVVGRSTLFDRWRQTGQERRQHLSERLVSHALSKILALAQSRPRNYIIDQTNVLEATRQKRLAGFKAFGSRCAVVVLPPLSEHATRLESYKESLNDPNVDDRYVNEEEVAEFKENLTLPKLDEGFTEITYVDCDSETAPKILADYKYDARRFRELNPLIKKSLPPKRPRILPPPSFERRPPRRFSPDRRPRRMSPKRPLSPRRPIREPRRFSPRMRSPLQRDVGKSQFRPRDAGFRERPGFARPYEYKAEPRPFFNKDAQPPYRSEYYGRGNDSSAKTNQSNSSYTQRRSNPSYSDNRRPSFVPPQTRTNVWDNFSASNRREPRNFDQPRGRFQDQQFQSDKPSRTGYSGYPKSSYNHY